MATTFRIRDTPVYQHAMDFAIAVDEFAEALPSYRGYLKTQLRRASLSGPLNLTEGSGDYAPAEKARIYRIGKRSVMEAATGLDYAARVEPKMAAWAAQLDKQALALTAEIHRFARAQYELARKIAGQKGAKAKGANGKKAKEPKEMGALKKGAHDTTEKEVSRRPTRS